MLEIIKYPNKILRQRSKNITEIASLEIQQFIPQLIETMIKKDGIGLAAPQLGRSINLMAVKLENGPRAFVNPRILWKNIFKKNMIEEGCLSFPDVFGFVKRPKTIWLKYKDQAGRVKISKFSGLAATVLQHEIDHLRGILFIDKILKYTKGEQKVRELIENETVR